MKKIGGIKNMKKIVLFVILILFILGVGGLVFAEDDGTGIYGESGNYIFDEVGILGKVQKSMLNLQISGFRERTGTAFVLKIVEDEENVDLKVKEEFVKGDLWKEEKVDIEKRILLYYLAGSNKIRLFVFNDGEEGINLNSGDASSLFEGSYASYHLAMRHYSTAFQEVLPRLEKILVEKQEKLEVEEDVEQDVKEELKDEIKVHSVRFKTIEGYVAPVAFLDTPITAEVIVHSGREDINLRDIDLNIRRVSFSPSDSDSDWPKNFKGNEQRCETHEDDDIKMHVTSCEFEVVFSDREWFYLSSYYLVASARKGDEVSRIEKPIEIFDPMIHFKNIEIYNIVGGKEVVELYAGTPIKIKSRLYSSKEYEGHPIPEKVVLRVYSDGFSDSLVMQEGDYECESVSYEYKNDSGKKVSDSRFEGKECVFDYIFPESGDYTIYLNYDDGKDSWRIKRKCNEVNIHVEEQQDIIAAEEHELSIRSISIDTYSGYEKIASNALKDIPATIRIAFYSKYGPASIKPENINFLLRDSDGALYDSFKGNNRICKDGEEDEERVKICEFKHTFVLIGRYTVEASVKSLIGRTYKLAQSKKSFMVRTSDSSEDQKIEKPFEERDTLKVADKKEFSIHSIYFKTYLENGEIVYDAFEDVPNIIQVAVYSEDGPESIESESIKIGIIKDQVVEDNEDVFETILQGSDEICWDGVEVDTKVKFCNFSYTFTSNSIYIVKTIAFDGRNKVSEEFEEYIRVKDPTEIRSLEFYSVVDAKKAEGFYKSVPVVVEAEFFSLYETEEQIEEKVRLVVFKKIPGDVDEFIGEFAGADKFANVPTSLCKKKYNTDREATPIVCTFVLKFSKAGDYSVFLDLGWDIPIVPGGRDILVEEEPPSPTEIVDLDVYQVVDGKRIKGFYSKVPITIKARFLSSYETKETIEEKIRLKVYADKGEEEPELLLIAVGIDDLNDLSYIDRSSFCKKETDIKTGLDYFVCTFGITFGDLGEKYYLQVDLEDDLGVALVRKEVVIHDEGEKIEEEKPEIEEEPSTPTEIVDLDVYQVVDGKRIGELYVKHPITIKARFDSSRKVQKTIAKKIRLRVYKNGVDGPVLLGVFDGLDNLRSLSQLPSFCKKETNSETGLDYFVCNFGITLGFKGSYTFHVDLGDDSDVAPIKKGINIQDRIPTEIVDLDVYQVVDGERIEGFYENVPITIKARFLSLFETKETIAEKIRLKVYENKEEGEPELSLIAVGIDDLNDLSYIDRSSFCKEETDLKTSLNSITCTFGITFGGKGSYALYVDLGDDSDVAPVRKEVVIHDEGEEIKEEEEKPEVEEEPVKVEEVIVKREEKPEEGVKDLVAAMEAEVKEVVEKEEVEEKPLEGVGEGEVVEEIKEAIATINMVSEKREKIQQDDSKELYVSDVVIFAKNTGKEKIPGVVYINVFNKNREDVDKIKIALSIYETGLAGSKLILERSESEFDCYITRDGYHKVCLFGYDFSRDVGYQVNVMAVTHNTKYNTIEHDSVTFETDFVSKKYIRMF